MKIYFSKYRDHWYSPYTMLEHIFFWTDWSKCSRNWTLADSLEDTKREKSTYVERPEWCEKVANYLTPISRGIQWVLDKVHPRIEYVKIDRWDTWNMDRTLAPIILPMLKQLQATKHGSQTVDLEDVPEELRHTNNKNYGAQQSFDFYDESGRDLGYEGVHARWDWVLGEMIFAFEHLVDESWQDAYRSGEHDLVWIPVDKDGNVVPKGEHKYYQMGNGPKDTYKCDYDGIRKVEERMQNGFRLFGKYYRGLWD